MLKHCCFRLRLVYSMKLSRICKRVKNQKSESFKSNCLYLGTYYTQTGDTAFWEGIFNPHFNPQSHLQNQLSIWSMLLFFIVSKRTFGTMSLLGKTRRWSFYINWVLLKSLQLNIAVDVAIIFTSDRFFSTILYKKWWKTYCATLKEKKIFVGRILRFNCIWVLVWFPGIFNFFVFSIE